MNPTHTQLLSFYRQYLREANRIHHYSFKEYAKRKIRYDFKTKYVSHNTILSELQTVKRIARMTTMYCENNHLLTIKL